MPYYIKRKKKKGGRSELQKWIAKLDKVMSLYVRMRDSKEFHFRYFRCISCGQVKPIEQGDCGHYVSRTHMALRFDTRNMNCECRHCNRFSADHLIGYRRNLVMKLGRQSFRDKHPGVTIFSTESVKECQRLGEQQVLLLEMMKNQTRKWSVFELQELYKYYSALILKMKEEL